ncbi:MAG: hypothetical protein H6850_01530 [Alphaproteobacteria bacterium]|nr:MAG: hypothetical protein H6850_01530 [Alphaproteobacteria bacterium]
MGTTQISTEEAQFQDIADCLEQDKFRIFPTYSRPGFKKIQKTDYSSFFKKADEAYLELVALRERLDNPILKERVQKLIDKILFQKKVYADKVVYTVHRNPERPFKKVCLMLHGMLDSAENFATLAPDVDDVLYVVPQGFKVCYPLPGPLPLAWNYQWFSLGAGSIFRPNPITIKEGLEENRPFLMQWLDDLAMLVGGYENVMVCGFSQGAVVALDLLTQNRALSKVISVAGGMHPHIPLELPQTEKRVLLIHCPKDRIVPFSLSKDSERRLIDLGAKVHFRKPIKHGHLVFTDTFGQVCMRHFIKGEKLPH